MSEMFNAQEKNELNILRVTTEGLNLTIDESITPHLYERMMKSSNMEEVVQAIIHELWPEESISIENIQQEDTSEEAEGYQHPVPEDDYFGPPENEVDTILLPEEDLMMINTLKILHENAYEALKFLENNQGKIPLADELFKDKERIDEMIQSFILIWNGEISAQSYESYEGPF